MRKTLTLQNLGCASCADKMERRINKIDGVISASISFAAQKLFLEVEEGKFEKIVEKAQQVCSKIEPDCRIVY